MKPKTLAEIYDTPALQLTRREIAQLDEQSRRWVLNAQARHERQRGCPAHEPVLIGNERGWHRIRCRYCGMDMASYDGG
jgi:hypothetical protein